jgi:cellulose synthase/poly-beta-1,6-N-acetylglucosamine synthase-like glycosyltransferase
VGTNISTLINEFNFFICLLFALLYSYKIVYMITAFKIKLHSKKNTVTENDNLCKYAVIIAARNEELVIGKLINTINNQNYPKDLIDIFVVADNCTDNTARVAAEEGAIVSERFNKTLIGKGYALDYMFKIINREYSTRKYDGYFVFDADNLLDENYILEMNQTFNQGYRIITSYRNSKNYDQNWITAGYGLWFLHEAEYINLPRMTLNTSCAISGTGFLVHADIIEVNGGWIHHLLTEDIEFSVSQIIKGEKIGYCRNAVLYDEQPITFEQSWHQRLRWAKGFYQVFANYGWKLIKGIFSRKNHKFSCYDMTMTIMPSMLLSGFCILINAMFYISGLFELIDGKMSIEVALITILKSFGWNYIIMFMLGLITTFTEWKKINSPSWKKVAYTFTFPIFMITYLPISIVALFKDVEWKPIAHTVAKSLDDL